MRWWPQGITTSADASDAEDIDGRRLLMTSWYSKDVGGENRGSRVTVIDIDTLEYRHVLLVVPERTSRRPARAAAAARARRRAGVVRPLPARGRHPAGSVQLHDRRHHPRRSPPTDTFGYRYVLPCGSPTTRPRVTAWSRCATPSSPSTAAPTRRSCVAGEYGVADMTRRLVRFPLDPQTYHLAATEDGTSRPVWLDERGLGHMQGAAIVRDTYYVTASRGRYRLGKMYVGEPGSFRSFPRTLPVGPGGHLLLALHRPALVTDGVPGPSLRVRDEASPVRLVAATSVFPASGVPGAAAVRRPRHRLARLGVHRRNALGGAGVAVVVDGAVSSGPAGHLRAA